jgi:hypothetical protein
LPSLDTLVKDIYGMFSGDHFPHDPQEFVTFGKNLEELFHERFNSTRSGAPTLRMSNIGKADRQLWMDFHSKEEREAFLPQTLIKFSYGDMIEQLMLLYAKMAGHTVEREQDEIEVDGIKGHIDAVIDGVVVDIKSASTFSFQKFESGLLLEPGNDPFGYLAQLAGYVEAVTPGGDGAFLAVDKTLGKVTLLRVPAEVLQRYRVRDRIKHIKEVVASPEMPPVCAQPVPDGKSSFLFRCPTRNSRLVNDLDISHDFRMFVKIVEHGELQEGILGLLIIPTQTLVNLLRQFKWLIYDIGK